MHNKNVKNDAIIAGVIFLFTVLFSLVSFSTIRIRPDIFLVAPIVASLLIESWLVFFGVLLAIILWLKFSPYFSLEYAIIFLLGAISFIVSKFLIFRNILAVRIVFLLAFQGIFWLVLRAGDQIFSLVFILEFIYNIIIEELLFAFGIWLKKKSF